MNKHNYLIIDFLADFFYINYKNKTIKRIAANSVVSSSINNNGEEELSLNLKNIIDKENVCEENILKFIINDDLLNFLNKKNIDCLLLPYLDCTNSLELFYSIFDNEILNRNDKLKKIKFLYFGKFKKIKLDILNNKFFYLIDFETLFNNNFETLVVNNKDNTNMNYQLDITNLKAKKLKLINIEYLKLKNKNYHIEELICQRFFDFNPVNIINNLPNLKSLELLYVNNFQNRDLKEILAKNPNIKDIKIFGQNSFVDNIKENIVFNKKNNINLSGQNFLNLEIFNTKDVMLNSIKSQNIILKNINELKIYLYDKQSLDFLNNESDIKNIKYYLENIKKLKIYFDLEDASELGLLKNLIIKNVQQIIFINEMPTIQNIINLISDYIKNFKKFKNLSGQKIFDVNYESLWDLDEVLLDRKKIKKYRKEKENFINEVIKLLNNNNLHFEDLTNNLLNIFKQYKNIIMNEKIIIPNILLKQKKIKYFFNKTKYLIEKI